MSRILEILKNVVHPEQGKDIVSLDMVTDLHETPDAVRFTLQLHKANDPMAKSVKRMAEVAVIEAMGISPMITIAEPRPRAKKPQRPVYALSEKCKIIAVASGKGGVGKSTVTANLAVALFRMGYSVGVIDADIYGPSMPKMFRTEDYVPVPVEGTEFIQPAEAYGIKLMSVGYFITPNDALVWRGPMANNALKQLIHQTAWGELDYLLIDLPPGTGDIHLTVVGELKISGAIIVSTPQRVALIDVVRGVNMFRSEHIAVPILGIVSNMAYFTPAELPDNRYYIFGRGEIEKVAEDMAAEILAEIPIVQSIAESGDNGAPIALQDTVSANIFAELAQKIIEKTNK